MSTNGQDNLTPFRPAWEYNLAPRQGTLAFQEHNYTWEQVLRVLRKHARSSLFLACLLSGLVFAYAMLQKDFYRPTARLEIAPPGSGINTLHEIDSTLPVENQDYLETQVQILNSDALAMSVIRELHLASSPEFVGNRQRVDSAGNPPVAASQLSAPRQSTILQEQINLATLTPAEFAALETFRKRLSVSSIRNTRLVEINFSANGADDAQLITNTLISNFIDQNYKHRYTTTMQASEWLSSQLDDLRKKVEDSGQAVAEYQKKFGLVEVDDRDVPTSQLMNEVNHQLSEAQANRIENEAYIRMIDEGHIDAIPALRDDKLFQDLMSHYVDLRTQLAQARTVYGDANINVKKLEDQLAEVSTQIDAERKRAVARARATYTASRQREQLMGKQREQLLSLMVHQGSELTTFHMLKEEANANAGLYNTLQGRLREAGIYAGLRSSNIRVVDMASNLPKPTGPNRPVIIAIGCLAAILFAIVFAFVRESFRNTVRTPDDVRSWTGLPSLALLPAMQSSTHPSDWELGDTWRVADLWQSPKSGGKRMVEIMKSPSTESESMRDLRTALLNAKLSTTPRVILISSSIEGEGKTTVAVNFAAALAQVGRTCLVDGDLRHPSVAGVFKIKPLAPLTDVLSGKVKLKSALVEIKEIPDLSVLPCGVVPGSPADVLSSIEMKILLEQLKQEFRFVVIDSPPVIRFSDARSLSSISDEVVLVGRYGVTTRRAIQRSTEILEEMKASVAGVVLNGIDLSSPDYDYYTYGYANGKNKYAQRHYPSTPENPPNGGSAQPGAMSAHA
jgi:capsular exopolysaccharide synthesis family protein